jgi:hypothetical protein
MKSDTNQLAEEILKDGIELLRGLLEEIKLKIKEMRGGSRT